MISCDDSNWIGNDVDNLIDGFRKEARPDREEAYVRPPTGNLLPEASQRPGQQRLEANSIIIQVLRDFTAIRYFCLRFSPRYLTSLLCSARVSCGLYEPPTTKFRKDTWKKQN